MDWNSEKVELQEHVDEAAVVDCQFVAVAVTELFSTTHKQKKLQGSNKHLPKCMMKNRRIQV